MQNIHIILIDDDTDYCQSLKSKARSVGIDDYNVNLLIADFQNLEEGFAELHNFSGKYKALILDAKALITKEQETAKTDFLAAALSRLQSYHNTKGFIPFAICTGFYDKFKEDFDTTIINLKGKLFDKSTEEDLMLAYLFNQVSNAENTKIEMQYADVFEIFELGHLNLSLKADLISIIKKLNDPTEIKNNFNPLRKILEEVYKTIHRTHPTYFPSQLFSNGNPVLDWIWYYLKGEARIRRGTSQVILTNPNPVESHYTTVIKCLEELSSIQSHSYTPTVAIYTYKSAVNALLETLLWFKKFMTTP